MVGALRLVASTMRRHVLELLYRYAMAWLGWGARRQAGDRLPVEGEAAGRSGGGSSGSGRSGGCGQGAGNDLGALRPHLEVWCKRNITPWAGGEGAEARGRWRAAGREVLAGPEHEIRVVS